MARQDAALTTDELVERMASLSRRLSKHLDALDDGDDDAAEDVAGIVRTLLGYGSGNKAILRLARALRIDLPTILVAAPVPDHPDQRFGLGSVPSDHEPAETEQSTASRRLDLRTWLETDAIVSPSSVRKRTPWHLLASDYGNTFGSHLSRTVPEVLQTMYVYGAPGGTLSGYLLRILAVAAEQSLAVMLPVAGVHGSVRTGRSYHRHGAELLGIDVHGRFGGFRFAGTLPSSVEVVRVPFDRGQVLVARWVMAEGEATGGMEMSIEE